MENRISTHGQYILKIIKMHCPTYQFILTHWLLSIVVVINLRFCCFDFCVARMQTCNCH